MQNITKKQTILITSLIILSFMLSFLSFTSNSTKSQPFLTMMNLKASVDVDPPTTSVSYTPTYAGNGYWLNNFEDQSLHTEPNCLAHDVESSGGEWAPNITNIVPAYDGSYCMNLTGHDYGISWLWMKYSHYTVYQASAMVRFTSFDSGGWFALIHVDYPLSSHQAYAYVEFASNGAIVVLDMQGTNQYYVAAYSLNTWTNVTIRNDLYNDPVNGYGYYSVYINGTLKRTTAMWGNYQDVNSFSIEDVAPGMYVDDYQMNTPMTPPMENFVGPSTQFTLSTNDNDSDATTMFKVWDNTTNTEIQDWEQYNAPFTLGSSANGTYTIVYCSNDDCGNESLKYEQIQIDATAPVTTLAYTPMFTHSGMDFVNLSTVFRLSATDGNGSDIVLTGYSVAENGSVLTGGAYTGPFDLASIPGIANGMITIGFLSEDAVGHFESANYKDVYLDLAYPVSTLIYTPTYTNGSKNYVSKLTPFTIVGFDGLFGSGIAAIHYKYTGHAWTIYSTPFALSSATNGTCVISYYAIDNVNNNETLNTETVYIDGIAPITIIHFTPNFYPNYVNSSTIFTLTAMDNVGGTGVASTWYRVNHNIWLPYTVPFNLQGEGNNTVVIDYFSIDIAGNIENTNSITVLNANHHVDVTIRYGSSIDGLGIPFLDVFTFINGTQINNDMVSFYGSLIFNLTVENIFNVIIFSQVYNATITGPSLNIALPITLMPVKNNFDYPVVFHLSMRGVVLSYSMNPGDEFSLRVALGTYLWYITNASNNALISPFRNNATKIISKTISGPGTSISFGWIEVPIGPVDYMSILAGYVVLFVILGVIAGVVIGVIVRRQGMVVQKSTESSKKASHEKDEERKIGRTVRD